MSIDLQEPISTVRSVAQTAAGKAADLAPAMDVGTTARRAAKQARRSAHRAATRAERTAHRATKQARRQVEDLRDATGRRSTGRTVLTVAAIAVGVGIAVWLVRRRVAASAVPEIAPDAFGAGVAATEGPAATREPVAFG